ncbi:hypothetical protein BGW38_009490 [Lunasporangiospora selenospora]|uniref:Transcription initiation factor IIF subunit alpha n=1 Tax=Lunasporangiospora selenospora TaxID=979761 RepID=A0A9P6FX93_9FUNG|nr:hypothetical protein BGW38_009490 [Lunasporangiospora selenospora]
MSFLRSRPPVQSNRSLQQQHQRSAGGANGPAIKKKIEKPSPQPLPGTYTDYKLVSTSREVLHHIMRFHGNKDVNPTTFTPPVKLHRKRNENSYYRGYGYYNNRFNNFNNNRDNPAAGENPGQGAASSSSTGPGAPGAAPGTVGGLPGVAPTTGADMTKIAPFGGGVRNKQMLFKKRTRQIYIANEEERRKKEIESAPWVVEDYDNQNVWTGQLEGGQHANYVLFVFTDDGFKVVPADKWYKFSPKLQYATLTAEEAEEQYQKYTKQQSNIRWLMKSKTKVKTEDGEEGGEEDLESEQFMTVDHEDQVGYDEDEARERKRKRGKHGDVDEMDFEEVWQDDEEAPAEMPGFDDDAKDDPRRKHGPSMESDEEDDDDESGQKLNDTGKEIKKALLKLEKNKAYASDDDKDPYASEKESSDSDLDEVDKDKDGKKDEDGPQQSSQDQQKSKKKPAANSKNAPLIAKKAGATKAGAASAVKPVGAKAKPRVPMPTPRNASVAAQANGAASSSGPQARAHSPTPGPASSTQSALPASMARSSSPLPLDKKRKKPDSADGADDGTKKHPRLSEAASSSASSTVSAAPSAAAAPASGDDSLLISETEVISLLRSRPQMTTRDLINELKRKLRKEPRNKNILAQIVKKVALSHDGVLSLREGY